MGAKAKANTTTTTTTTYTNMTKGKMTPLPPTFQPGPYDVICAKGKDARNHEGNKFFRKLIQNALPIYKEASSKFEKSMIVSEVIVEIRSRTQIDGVSSNPMAMVAG